MIETQHAVQIPDRAYIAQDPFGINVFINVQRSAPAGLAADPGFMIPGFAFQQPGKPGPFPGQAAEKGSRGEAPGAGKGIIFQTGSGFLGKDVGIFPAAAAGLLRTGDHVLREGEPVGMLRSHGLFAFVCLQHQIDTLAHQISRVPGNGLFVIPPAAVVPYAVLLRKIRQAVSAVDTAVDNMTDTVKRLRAHRLTAQAAGGQQHRYRCRESVRPGNRRKEAVFVMGSPVENETGIPVGIRNPGVSGHGGGDVPDGFIDGGSFARGFMPERVNLLQHAVNLPFILRRPVKAGQDDGDAFSPTDPETVLTQLFPRQNLMGIHKEPRRVLISQGIPNFTVRKGTAESGVLIKIPGQSRPPRGAGSVPADIIRRS